MKGADLRRRFNVWFALWVVAGGLVGLFLAVPLDNTGLHPFVITVQGQLRQALLLLSPFLMVGALGAAVGLAELTSTFTDYPREAIASQWGQILVWLNSSMAVLAYLVARIYAPADTNPIMIILGVGVGFPALIRTKFTIAKQIGGSGSDDLSVNFGWLYDQFQNLCKKQIDVDLMSYRRLQVDKLLARYNTVQELYQTALYTVKARATLTPVEERERLEDLQQTIDPKVPPELARMNLGLFILEVGGLAYVDLLVRARTAPEPEMNEAAGTATADIAQAEPAADNSPDAVAKRLIELPLTELVDLGLALCRTEDDHLWIKQASAPAPGLSELRQKAPIAYYIISRVGAEAAARALASR